MLRSLYVLEDIVVLPVFIWNPLFVIAMIPVDREKHINKMLIVTFFDFELKYIFPEGNVIDQSNTLQKGRASLE